MTNITIRVYGDVIAVLVHGLDARMVQSAEAYIISAAEETGASVSADDDPHLVQSVPPEHYYSGFTAEEDPGRACYVLRAIEAEAESISWVALSGIAHDEKDN